MASFAAFSGPTCLRPAHAPAARASPTCASLRQPAPQRAAPCLPAARRARGAVVQRRNLRSQVAATDPAGPVNDTTFEELVLKSPVPVMVDFWAPWCGPCRMIAPLIDELAVEYGDRLRALKLNTDESPGIATEYGIRSIPTVMFFKDGQKCDTVIGAVPKSTLVQTLEKYMD